MTALALDLNWSIQLSVTAPSNTPTSLTGDKILLPQSALEQLLAASSATQQSQPPVADSESWDLPQLQTRQHQQLPHPLIFRLYNPANNRFSHAVPREFSAAEGEVGISPFLREALGLEERGEEPLQEGEEEGSSREGPRITIVSKSLPKGTHVRLRPLEAGYDDEDWKALLERHLRRDFTTLTVGEILSVSGRTNSERKKDQGEFRFLIDKLEPGEAVCIVDTDLEVDIEPLSEEQARETLKQRIARKAGSSTGGVVKIGEPANGQVLPGGYHFYELKEWKRDLPLVIDLDGVGDGDEVDVFVSTSKQHHKPRDDEHIWGDIGSSYPKRIEITPTNIELIDATTVSIGIHGYRALDVGGDEESETEPTRPYVLQITQPTSAPENSGMDIDMNDDIPPRPDYKKCANCTQWIPSRTFILHENFCLRNNYVCKECKQIFKRGTESQHWHCSQCKTHGNNAPFALEKHTSIYHHPRHCTACPYEAANIPDLAVHKTTTCPGKIILCKFCHLLVPQEGEGDGSQPDVETIMTGLSKHELDCGSRTTECHLCSKIIKLRNMETHLKNHDLQRLSKSLPTICRNLNCAHTLKSATNELGLCGFCFGLLYVQMYDLTGSQLKRSVERKLLQQLLSGCGKDWCQNNMCKSGLANRGVKLDGAKPDGAKPDGAKPDGAKPDGVMSMAKAFPIIKPMMDKLADRSVPLELCVDKSTKERREMAEWICAESALQEKGGYDLAFTIAAVEAAEGDRDRAWRWLEREGVRKGERNA